MFAKMKKRHDVVSESSLGGDLKSLIHQHSEFFDKLIELIPAKFYLPVDEGKAWFPGLSKEEKALAKKESKENIKKSRRDRLDPEKSSTTTLDLLKQNLEKEKSNDESDEEVVELNPMMSGLEADDRSVTYEDLRQRLHRKIEELRSGRNSGGSEKVRKDSEKNEKKKVLQKKRKRESGPEAKHPSMGASSENMEKVVTEAAKELKFSNVKIGNDEEHGKNKKKRKLSKLKELEKAKELAEAKDLEKGEAVSKKLSWNAATSRAAGIKVHDDPKLLERSIKKEKKRHQKNAEKWKERVNTQQKVKAEKQHTRSQNIAEKIHQKKMRRIAKREKKLMRPGFEGRKEGYINEGST